MYSHVWFPFLQVLGNVTEFHRAVKLVIETVSFDKDSTVQVFEANIRCSISLFYSVRQHPRRLVDKGILSIPIQSLYGNKKCSPFVFYE